MKTFTVRRGHFGRDGKFVGEMFDCDVLPEPLYTDVYVSVALNRAVSWKAIDAALEENA